MPVRDRYLVVISLTVATRLSRASRLAPTGTSTTRSASSWTWSTRVLGWVGVVCGVEGLRADVVLRVAGLRAPVLLVVAIVAFSTPVGSGFVLRGCSPPTEASEHVFVNRGAALVTVARPRFGRASVPDG